MRINITFIWIPNDSNIIENKEKYQEAKKTIESSIILFLNFLTHANIDNNKQQTKLKLNNKSTGKNKMQNLGKSKVPSWNDEN